MIDWMNITLTRIAGLWEKLCAETEEQVLCKYQVEDAMPSEVEVGRCVGRLRCSSFARSRRSGERIVGRHCALSLRICLR